MVISKYPVLVNVFPPHTVTLTEDSVTLSAVSEGGPTHGGDNTVFEGLVCMLGKAQ